MKLRFILFVSILVLSVIAASAEPTAALPFDNEHVNQSLAVGANLPLYISLSSGDVLSGYFETDDTTMGLDFFIADAANYLIWNGGGDATGYEVVTNMHTNYFSLTVPSSDTWYLVFINNDDVTVWFDAAIDVNGDNTPIYSSSTYDFTAYGKVIEPDEWYYTFGTYDAGTEFTGHFSTFFSSDGVDFFICDQANYDIWNSGGNPSVYGLKENFHQANIDSFTVPTSGTWYFVFSAVGMADTVTLSVGINIDTSGVTETTTPTNTGNVESTSLFPMLIIIAGVLVGLVGLVVCKSKKEPSPGPQPTRGTQPPAPGSGTNKEMVLGALKSYPRVSMGELAEILEIPKDVVRRLTLMLIASGEIKGTFNKNTDEFTSISASKVGSELRRDAKDELDIQRCPNCGAPISGSFVVGDDIECNSCGIKFNV